MYVSPKRAYRWQVSTWGNIQHRKPLGKCTLKLRRYHYAPVRMANIKNNNNTKWWLRCRETRSCMQGQWYVKLYGILENGLAVSEKLNLQRQHHPAVAPSAREVNTHIHRKPVHGYLSRFIPNSQTLKTTQMSFSGKLWSVHAREYYSAIKKITDVYNDLNKDHADEKCQSKKLT